MPTVAEDITAVDTIERETPTTTPMVTTLYDLIATLNAKVEPWEDDVVTAIVADLCHTGNLHFLRVPGDCKVVRTSYDGMQGRKKEMAIVLVEEVLMGLDEVKLSLDQAVTVLADMIDDMRPAVGDHLKASLETQLLRPLQSRVIALETLMEELADTM